jgi:hypothetical protein
VDPTDRARLAKRLESGTDKVVQDQMRVVSAEPLECLARPLGRVPMVSQRVSSRSKKTARKAIGAPPQGFQTSSLEAGLQDRSCAADAATGWTREGRLSAVRIGLVSDCEGNAAALEAAFAALRKHAADVLVHAGDVLCCPFSPDPPAETIGLLRAQGVRTILGNHDRYLVDWGTPRWPHTLWMRLRRSDPAGAWLDDVSAGQAQVASADLAWLAHAA